MVAFGTIIAVTWTERHLKKDTCEWILVLTLLVNLFAVGLVQLNHDAMIHHDLLILWKHSLEIWCVNPWNQAAQHRASLCS